MKTKYGLTTLLLILLVLNTLDYITTINAVGAGGIERNPVSAWLIAEGKYTEIKLAVTSMLIFMSAFLAYFAERTGIPERLEKAYTGVVYLAVFMIAAYTFIVLNNIVWWFSSW